MAAHKPEYLYLSLYTITQRNFTILTAIYMFSFFMNPIKLFFILRDASGSQKFKMAAHKTVA